MKLELVPVEGDEKRLLSAKDRERMKKRLRDIKPEELAHFSMTERIEIKQFMAYMIGYSEMVNHDLQDKEHLKENEAHLKWSHKHRQMLIKNASPAVKDFIKITDICAVEPWLEWEVLLDFLRSHLKNKYYETMNQSGLGAAKNNPFLMQVNDTTDEQHQDELHQARLTLKDIQEYIYQFPIEDLVKYLVQSRKVITGEFWVKDYSL